jgi:hypothetical protein
LIVRKTKKTGGIQMSRRFSDKELFELRNYIPIEDLLEDLMIPNKISEGYLRFLCPVCNEFLTSKHPKENLGRCFRCDRNFNPIDLVKIAKQLDFVQTVEYLKAYRKMSLNNKEA